MAHGPGLLGAPSLRGEATRLGSRASPRVCSSLSPIQLNLPISPPSSMTQAGLSAIWVVRERVMGRAGADTYSAFAFPPLAVVLSGLVARAAAGLVLARWGNRSKHQHDASLLSPSLPLPGTSLRYPFSLP